MARKFGRINSYQSRIRKCAMCGRKYYEQDMIKKDEKYYDEGCYDPPQDSNAGMKLIGPK